MLLSLFPLKTFENTIHNENKIIKNANECLKVNDID